MKKPVKLMTYRGLGGEPVAYDQQGRTYVTAERGGQLMPVGLVGEFKFVGKWTDES